MRSGWFMGGAGSRRGFLAKFMTGQAPVRGKGQVAAV